MFGTAASTRWDTSSIRTYLNGTFINNKLPFLKDKIVETTITTRTAHNASTWMETQDKVFFLTEADLFGNHSGTPTSDPRDYTYGNSALVPNIDMRKSSPPSWLRSPRLYNGSQAVIALVRADGLVGNGGPGTSNAVRPAMWVEMP